MNQKGPVKQKPQCSTISKEAKLLMEQNSQWTKPPMEPISVRGKKHMTNFKQRSFVTSAVFVPPTTSKMAPKPLHESSVGEHVHPKGFR